MREVQFCRVCANLTNCTVEIFERSRRRLLRQIEELIGQRLKNIKALPQQICEKCQEQTVQAHLFRECCIRAQKHFATAAYQTQMKAVRHRTTIENEGRKSPVVHKLAVLSSKEVHLDSINLIKAEVDKSSEAKSPFLKHEASTYTNGCFPLPNAIDYPDTNTLAITPAFDVVEPQLAHCSIKATKIEEESFSTEVSPNHKHIQLKYREGRPRGRKCKIKKPDEKKKTKCKNSKNVTGKPEYICDQCGTHFTNFTIFNTHLRRHAGEKPFQCEICPDKFLSQAQLLRHIRKHTGEKPYPCRHCQRRFLDSSARVRHERVHNNERPFTCQQCGKSFTVSYTLKEHMRIHTGERAFICTICNVSFTLKAHLVTHYRSMTHKQNEEKQPNLQSQTSALVTQKSSSRHWDFD